MIPEWFDIGSACIGFMVACVVNFIFLTMGLGTKLK